MCSLVIILTHIAKRCPANDGQSTWSEVVLVDNSTTCKVYKQTCIKVSDDSHPPVGGSSSSQGPSNSAGVHLSAKSHNVSIYSIHIPCFTENMKAKRERCGVCTACISSDCGSCKYCKDKPKFNGPGKLKQSYIKCRCLHLNYSCIIIDSLLSDDINFAF